MKTDPNIAPIYLKGGWFYYRFVLDSEFLNVILKSIEVEWILNNINVVVTL